MTCYLNGSWSPATGHSFRSFNPATGECIWQGNAAAEEEVNAAVAYAKEAAEGWCLLPLEERIPYLNAFATWLTNNKKEMATTISKEMGKPLWEANGEVNSMIGKIAISINAYNERCEQKESKTGKQKVRFNPHGTLAVFGPFNFPGHLPNGHIIPALLAGNTLVFKPSEKTPLTAELTMKGWHASGLPKGVLNMVQGGYTTGKLLAQHPALDGLLFTGSWNTGKALSQQFSTTPGRILALEMGGNNPLVIWDVADLDAAAYLTLQSAYLTSGQRCTCARRLIVANNPEGEALIETIKQWISLITVGPYTQNPEPFMGPLISAEAAQELLDAQEEFIREGGKALIPMRRLPLQETFLSPGLIDVTAVKKRADREFFGPLLQVIRVEDFSAALAEANNTAYGLSAGIITDNSNLYYRFLNKIKAGVINWNAATTGTSSELPFGGIGQSGNHRPSAYFAADYCSYPIASTEHSTLSLPSELSPGIAKGETNGQ